MFGFLDNVVTAQPAIWTGLANNIFTAGNNDWLRLRAVEIKLRKVAKQTRPPQLQKHPEPFYWALHNRKSLSTKLFVKDTLKSLTNNIHILIRTQTINHRKQLPKNQPLRMQPSKTASPSTSKQSYLAQTTKAKPPHKPSDHNTTYTDSYQHKTA